jgi:hypothetical protein
MRHSQSPKQRQRLLPEGGRWGFGAHSVVPYLTHTRVEETADAAKDIRNPVFPQMEQALRTLRDRQYPFAQKKAPDSGGPGHPEETLSCGPLANAARPVYGFRCLPPMGKARTRSAEPAAASRIGGCGCNQCMRLFARRKQCMARDLHRASGRRATLVA